MKPYATIGSVDLYLGDCREVAPGLEQFAHVVSDPPYGLFFMGAGWDRTVPGPEFWTAICSRMLPGGSVFAFGGTRQFHRLACALEDAGLDVRDCLAWLHGQGFPKSYNIGEGVAAEASKVYDPAKHRKPSPVGLSEGEQQFVDWIRDHSGLTKKDLRRLVGCDRFWTGEEKIVNTVRRDKPPVWARCALVPTAAAWAKMRAAMAEIGVTPPDAIEDLVKSPPTGAQERFLATVSGGAQRGRPQGGNEWDGYGTGLKPAWEPIVWASKAIPGTYAQNAIDQGVAGLNIDGGRLGAGLATVPEPGGAEVPAEAGAVVQPPDGARWPSNVALDPVAAAELDAQSGHLTSGANPTRRSSDKFRDAYGEFKGQAECVAHRGADSGGASRFLYCAKPSARERSVGLDARNVHPTVKPVALMAWLLRMADTPTGLPVLDPFAGSGSTLCAAAALGRRAVGIELEEQFAEIAAKRLEWWAKHGADELAGERVATLPPGVDQPRLFET